MPTGTPVVALPLIRGAQGIDTVGLSAHAPGAYAEQLLAQESMMLPVPNGLAPDVAALTEPMAVAWHAVRRGEVGKRQVAIVIGCGPVGLGVILMLKAQGVRTVVASDFSPGPPSAGAGMRRRRRRRPRRGRRPTRRPATAATSTTSQPPSTWPSSTREKLGRLPVGWWHVWRAGREARRGAQAPGGLRVRRRARA